MGGTSPPSNASLRSFLSDRLPLAPRVVQHAAEMRQPGQIEMIAGASVSANKKGLYTTYDVMERNPTAEYLYLRENEILTVEASQVLPGLKVLDLSMNALQGSCEWLTLMPNLRHLYLTGNEIDSLYHFSGFLQVHPHTLRGLGLPPPPVAGPAGPGICSADPLNQPPQGICSADPLNQPPQVPTCTYDSGAPQPRRGHPHTCYTEGAYRALCARCAKSWLFSTTGSSVSSED